VRFPQQGYVLVGGLAVSFHGLPRTTMDLDLILRINEDEIPKLAEFLTQKDFWVNAEELKTALRKKTHCTILDKNPCSDWTLKGFTRKPTDARLSEGSRSNIRESRYTLRQLKT
jgi:molybdenum cofactor biosynthesis enzyme MoaA